MQPLGDRIVQQMIREQQIDLRRYGNVLARRKWLILGVAAIATLVLAAAALLLAPVYRASATLMIEAQEASVISIQNVYGIETRGQEYYQTQFEILKSRPLAEAVAKKLALSTQSEFNPQPLLPNFWSQWLPAAESTAPPPDKQSITVDRYLQHLLIQPKPKTQLVTVSFDAHDPALAMQIANAHAQAFIENHMEAKETMTRTAADWMSGRLQDLRQKLAASEQNLQSFKEREQLVDIDGMKNPAGAGANRTDYQIGRSAPLVIRGSQHLRAGQSGARRATRRKVGNPGGSGRSVGAAVQTDQCRGRGARGRVGASLRSAASENESGDLRARCRRAAIVAAGR